MTLAPVMTLEIDENFPWSTAYFPDGKRMISVYSDNTIRQWDLQAGKEIEEVRDVCGESLSLAKISRDCRWVMTSTGDEEFNFWELKAHEVETGIVKTFQDSRVCSGIDISADGKLLASGSFDGTVLIWGMDTGELVAGPFRSEDGVDAVRFSPDSKKLAAQSHRRKCLEVWDVQTQKLDARVGARKQGNSIPTSAVFWTKKGTILAAFNFDFDDNDSRPTTIYEFDASTLETVGDPFKGHTDLIHQLAFSFDGTLLGSSSFDDTIKLWSIEPHCLLATFDTQPGLYPSIIFSPDARQLAYSTHDGIFIYTIPPIILTSIRLASDAQAIVRICCIYLIVDVLISSSRSVLLTIQPLMSYSMCMPHCSIHMHY